MARTSGSMVKEIMRTLRMVRLCTRKARTWAKKANLEIEETWLLFPVLLLISFMFSRDFAMPLDGQRFIAIIRICEVLSLLLFPNITDLHFSIFHCRASHCHVYLHSESISMSSSELQVPFCVDMTLWKNGKPCRDTQRPIRGPEAGEHSVPNSSKS